MEPGGSWRVRIVLAIVLLGAGAGAEEGDKPLDVGGSLRTVGLAARNYRSEAVFGTDNPSDAVSQTLLRLTATGRPVPWLFYEVHGVENFDYSSAPEGGAGTGAFSLQAAGTRYRALREQWDQVREDDTSVRAWLDRASVKFSLGIADLTLGRQAINFSKAWFWNPLDVFLPFDARQFDRDYKPGMDAGRLDVALGQFSGLNAVGVAGRRSDPIRGGYADGAQALGGSWYASAAMLRAFTALAGWDLSAQGGKVYGGWQAGAGAAGETGPLSLRGEAAWFRASGGGDEVQGRNGPVRLLDDSVSAVAGGGHRFANSLDLEAEYLYNGAGLPRDLAAAAFRVASGDALHMGRHLTGVTATYELTALLTGRFSGVASLSDHSFVLQPGFAWSVSNESEFQAGAMLNRGRRPSTDEYGAPVPASEFGSYPDWYYAEYKFHF